MALVWAGPKNAHRTLRPIKSNRQIMPAHQTNCPRRYMDPDHMRRQGVGKGGHLIWY